MLDYDKMWPSKSQKKKKWHLARQRTISLQNISRKCYRCAWILGLEIWSHSIGIIWCCFLCCRHCLGFNLCWVLLWQPCCRSFLHLFPLDVGFFAIISKPCKLFIALTLLKIQKFIQGRSTGKFTVESYKICALSDIQ